jgi:acyl-CoA synthetase (AMP-forming)/AMP-acid ligase II
LNIIELLDETCVRFPAATALMWGVPGSGSRLSFADLADRSRRLASLFRQAGLRPGDAIVIFVPMSGPLYEVMAAVLRSGLIPVFVEPALWRETLDNAVSKLPVRGFVGTTAACALRWFVPALRRIPHAFVAGRAFPGATPLRAAARCSPTADVEPCPDGATALLTFTSGSTGRAKGVLRTHGMLVATYRILSAQLSLRAGEPNLTTLPFIAFVNLAAGASTVIPDLDSRRPGSADPERLVQQLREWNVSGLVTTPFLARGIAEFCRGSAVRLDSLRHVHTGGAPVLPELLEKLAEAAPQAQTGAVYGATEAEPIAFADLNDFGPQERNATRDGRGVLVGRPVDGVTVRVLSDLWGSPRGPYSAGQFERERVRDGVSGEIVVSGPNVSPGYLGGEGDRQQKIAVNGATWHRTGDAGYFDGSGRLWLTGRCAARIVHDHGTFYPLQAEAALAGLHAVERATLIKNSDERIVLVVQPAGAPEDVDIGDLASRLAWCRPHEIVMVKRIPMDRRHHAKVIYTELVLALDRRQWLARTVLSPLP